MQTILTVYIVAFLLGFFTFFEDHKDRYTQFIFGLMTLVLLLCSGFRPIGVDFDSWNYVSLYQKAEGDIVEITFWMLSTLVKMTFDDVRVLFLIYAAMTILIQTYAIRKMTDDWLLALLVLSSHYFIFQNMTQIRVAVSAAIFLCALYYLAKGKRWSYIILILIATSFHYSAAMLLPIVFFSNKDLTVRARYIMGGLIPVMYLLFFSGFDVFVSLPIPYIQNRMDAYEKLKETGLIGDEINPFNALFLLRLCIFYYILIKYDYFKKYSPYLSILLKIMCCSFCAFLGFGSLSIFAGRASELFGIVEIFIFTLLAYAVQPRALSRLLVVLLAFAMLTYDIFGAGLLRMI